MNRKYFDNTLEGVGRGKKKHHTLIVKRKNRNYYDNTLTFVLKLKSRGCSNTRKEQRKTIKYFQLFVEVCVLRQE